jgi:hypothetical protein
MHLQGIVSIAVIALGVVVIVVLVTLGAVVKKTLDDTVLSRLEYDLPEGYKTNPDYEECYRATKARFWEEYYLWNLTNLDEVLSGGKANFNLVGPFSYSQWYCQYDHSINKSAGILQYRTEIEGYMFLQDDSISNDDVYITNVNPAYLGLLEQLQGSEANIYPLMSGPAIEEIISTFQEGTTLMLVWLNAIPQVLVGMNQQIEVGITATAFVTQILPNFQSIIATFFNPAFNQNGVQGWAYYILNNVDPSANVTLSTSSENLIFAAWSASVASLENFAQQPIATIVQTYGVTTQQAGYLLYYTANYLLNPANPLVSASVLSNLYAQWANGSVSTTALYPGWEIGLPVATGISAADVARLFNATDTCSIASATGIQKWIALLTSKITSIDSVCPGSYSLTSTQQYQIAGWLSAYATTVEPPILLSKFGISNWNEFAYAQWGSLVSGTSFGVVESLPYIPEIAAFTYTNKSGVATHCSFSVSEASSLLNGTFGLFNYTNMITFFTLYGYAQASSVYYTYIQAKWPELTVDRSDCLYQYLALNLIPNAIMPEVNTAMAAGGTLFTTRTAREWLFTAVDPLLVLLKQPSSAALVGNKTVSKEEADLLDYTYVRIYTGDNDLHHSLMPINEGDPLPFWRGDVTITGYNGSQFLPNGYLDQSPSDKKYPLLMWNRLINRTILFQNGGKDTWDGVNVRYLKMDDSTLLSEAENADNYAYYAQYSGVINKTSNPPSYLPIFLTTPNFLSAETDFYSNVTFTDTIWAPTYDPTDKLSRHRLSLFILAEPTLGSSLWGNLPIQVNFKYGPTTLFPNVVPAYAPIYWNAIGNIATQKDLNQVKTDLYANQRAWKALIGVGVGFGTICLIGGIIGVHHYYKHKDELKEIPTDSKASTITSSQ